MRDANQCLCLLLLQRKISHREAGSDAAAASHCGSCRPPGAATVDANYLLPPQHYIMLQKPAQLCETTTRTGRHQQGFQRPCCREHTERKLRNQMQQQPEPTVHLGAFLYDEDLLIHYMRKEK
nr:uncharacterized protein LOC105477966 isoform X2 [Macaca nemestrina]XP_011733189.1 uncharacterized protein LOC105477966 isoform X2 [Macaca nemestrina]XP_011733190.1 uncharacterized protein LOC105477966 isoform X2 [Macaca nemestrina]